VAPSLISFGWAIAIPFPLTLLIVGPFVVGRLRGRTSLDAGYRVVAWNSARAVLGSAATAVVIAGFPALVVATTQAPAHVLAPFLLAVALTRAPIILPIMALQ